MGNSHKNISPRTAYSSRDFLSCKPHHEGSYKDIHIMNSLHVLSSFVLFRLSHSTITSSFTRLFVYVWFLCFFFHVTLCFACMCVCNLNDIKMFSLRINASFGSFVTLI